MTLVDDRVLTPEQQEFAEQHHGLLLKFMGTYGLTDDDYGILAERYVKTVKKYLETESLHQYRFSTILWYRLRADLISSADALGRKKRKAHLMTSWKLSESLTILAPLSYGAILSSRSRNSRLNCSGSGQWGSRLGK